MTDTIPIVAELARYPERYATLNGYECLVQVLNPWTDKPPRYMHVNSLSEVRPGEWICEQRLGTWMNVSLRDFIADTAIVIAERDALAARLAVVEGQDLYALLYLHDWDEPIQGRQPVYPQLHALYRSWQEAEAVRKSMTDPTQYWAVRARWEDAARLAKVAALTSLSEPGE